ncbi:MAG: CheA signal transduction histidine kinase [Candidatus Woesebacteria bacterium GW2011_GWB1_38_5b]|uniref:CheA signal transduction histidine kinase n=1 Tax=Candidatus Woesebacteria bacterium GW2011_GWB1_38_5b TaxID=1618569 RepID=A0A0G0K6Q0_9BACT|nr:MAG: CheA signal transduction histidine kinase [Candidatus Woesebacteria bacterium GW2011_GWB1_38_5b]
MKIHLPNSAWLGNIDPFLKSLNTSNPSKLEITAHKEWISLHPLALSMVAALGLSCKPQNIVSERIEAKSKHYLKRMNLFDLLKIKTDISIEEHESAGRFIPLTQISSNLELTKFITDVIPLLHLQPEQAGPIRYVISELTRNVFEHSRSKIGAILCAQYFKKTNRISIGIVDRGVGIKETISQSYVVKKDSEALRLALTPGVTGTTRRIGGTDYNAGAGLFFIKSIAKVNRDFFVIYSGYSMYKLLKTQPGKTVRLYGDPYKDKHSLSEGFPYWQGTAVGVDISLDSREQFSELLKLIRDIYSKTVKERRKEYYKKARFI